MSTFAESSIDIQFAADAPSDAPLPDANSLRKWACSALVHQAIDNGELTIRLVTEAESQQLNRDYRGRDKPTNVLSFPFESPPGFELALLGDLAICHAVVVREARAQNKRINDHYAHMVVHGVLHLLGLDHQVETQAAEMETREREILATLNIADPYLLDSERDHEDTRPHA